MDCQEEVAILQRRLTRLAGLEALDADVLGQRLRIKYDAAKLSTSAIAEAVAQTGMRAWLEHEEPPRRRGIVGDAACCSWSSRAWRWRRHGPRSRRRRSTRRWLRRSSLAIASGGVYSVRRAMHAARSLALDINVLMLVAVGGAMALASGPKAPAVVFLFALAQLLEARAMERARGAIRALMDLTPARRARPPRRHANGELAVDDVRDRRRRHRSARREDSARRERRGRRELRESGAGDRRVAAGREAAGRRGVRRHHQRPRRARRRASTRLRARLDARAHHSPRRAGAGAARARARRSSIGSRASTRPRCSCWPCSSRSCRRCCRRAVERPGSIARSCCS